MFKRIISVLLSVCLFLLCVGCKPVSRSLWVVFDLAENGVPYDSILGDLEWWLINDVGLEEQDIHFECLPLSGAERDTAIDRIRTEIMSGGGPDVFVTQCFDDRNALFKIPEKAMEIDLFLPLDDYIANAKYAEWDKFTKTVMDAGRNEEGQQLVPLAYQLPVAMYRATDLEHTPSNMTWEELRESEELQDAAVRVGAGLNALGAFDFQIDYILGDMADYRDEKLLFSEEDLRKYTDEVCAATKQYAVDKLFETEYCAKSSIGDDFNFTGGGTVEGGLNLNGAPLNGLREWDPLTLVPLYSKDGGCTAMVTAFAAINRNTQRPEDAFAFLDLLLSTGRQANAAIYRDYLYGSFGEAAMPMHEEIMSSKYPMGGKVYVNHTFTLTNQNFDTVCAVRDQITNVQFVGALNGVIEEMAAECFTAYQAGDDYSSIVHDAYSSMKQMMVE